MNTHTTIKDDHLQYQNCNFNYHPKYYDSFVLKQFPNQYNDSNYNKKLVAQGPNFLHNTKMNLSMVKLDVNNNAPALMNALIEKNREIKILEKEIKNLNKINVLLNNKLEMLKILASNFGASQDDIGLTMSTDDIFCVPKPSTSINYPNSESSFENLRINAEEDSDNSYLSEKNIINIKDESKNYQKQTNPKLDSKSNQENKKNLKTSQKSEDKELQKNFLKRASTLLKTTESLSNSMQSQNQCNFKYLTGTRFGPSIKHKMKFSSNINNKQNPNKNLKK